MLETETLNNGLKMPRLGLGTWMAKPKLTAEAVRVALRNGYRHIDCAWIYKNQKEVALGIRESGVPRKDVFLTSKIWMTDFAAERVRPAVLEILHDLETTYLDQLLLHWPVAWKAGDKSDPQWYMPKDQYGHYDVDTKHDLMTTWSEMEHLYNEGLFKSIGVCNFSEIELFEILQKCQVKPAVNQVELHPFLQQEDLKHYCISNGVLVTAYAPLGSPGMGFEDLLKDETIGRIAAVHKTYPANVLIRWSLQKGHVVFPKSTTPERIIENANVYHFELSKHEMSMIDGLGTKIRRVFNPPFRSGGKPVFDSQSNM